MFVERTFTLEPMTGM